jgi:hypothetical protein
MKRWYVMTNPCDKTNFGNLNGYVPSTLHQDIEYIVVLIHRPPQVMPHAVDGQKHPVEVSCVARSGLSMPQLIGILLPELAAPLADGFVGHVDATCDQELLHVTVAQGESIVEPDAVADDLDGKAVVVVASVGGGREHVWLPTPP